MRTLAFGLMCLSSLGVGAYAFVVYTLKPLGSSVHPDMRMAFEAHSMAIYCHIFASAVALVLGPWQFVAGLRRRWPRIHRYVGFSYLLIGVGLGGLSGLVCSTFAFGGMVSTVGFGLLAALWLYTGIRGLHSARKRQWSNHRVWMIRNFSLTFSAVTLRLYLGLCFALGFQFEVFYPCLAWLGWVPNWGVAMYLTRKSRTSL